MTPADDDYLAGLERALAEFQWEVPGHEECPGCDDCNPIYRLAYIQKKLEMLIKRERATRAGRAWARMLNVFLGPDRELVIGVGDASTAFEPGQRWRVVEVQRDAGKVKLLPDYGSWIRVTPKTMPALQKAVIGFHSVYGPIMLFLTADGHWQEVWGEEKHECSTVTHWMPDPEKP